MPDKEENKLVENAKEKNESAEAGAKKEMKDEKKAKTSKKSQKERPKSKKKHTNVQVWTKYKIEGNKVMRINESCPRCGEGTFLASYKDRKYCGKCGWSKILSEKNDKSGKSDKSGKNARPEQ